MKPRTIAIIQARMSSTRLPKGTKITKHLFIVAGKSFTFLVTFLLVSCASASPQMPTKTQTLITVATSTSTPAPAATGTPFHSEIPTHIPTSTFTPPLLERAENDNVSGTYYGRLNDKDPYAGCVLKVALQEPNPPFEEIGFELLCNRGAPSYNLGYNIGKLLLVDNIAVYTHKSGLSLEIKCNIVFQFEDNAVKVTQLGTDFDCGFGHGVYANGYYELVDDQPPVLGCIHPAQINEQCMTLTPSP